MNGNNTPRIAGILQANQLSYIPEAHCYLKYNHTILDYTTLSSSASDFEAYLIETIEIKPDQISDYKVAYHKAFLTKWLEQTGQDNYTLDSIWKVREQCIERLAESTID